jgi:hypothetical protein
MLYIHTCTVGIHTNTSTQRSNLRNRSCTEKAVLTNYLKTKGQDWLETGYLLFFSYVDSFGLHVVCLHVCFTFKIGTDSHGYV